MVSIQGFLVQLQTLWKAMSLLRYDYADLRINGEKAKVLPPVVARISWQLWGILLCFIENAKRSHPSRFLSESCL